MYLCNKTHCPLPTNSKINCIIDTMRKMTETINSKFWHIPNYRAGNILDIDFAQLAKSGITKVAIDIDGTLLPGGSLGEIVGEYTEHIAKARKAGHIERLVVATNRFSVLARNIGMSLNADSVVTGSIRTRKPSMRYYRYLLSELGGESKNTIMIGDKLWQDIFGSNRAGMYSLLVDDYGPEPFYERVVLHRYRQNKRLKHLEAKLAKLDE